MRKFKQINIFDCEECPYFLKAENQKYSKAICIRSLDSDADTVKLVHYYGIPEWCPLKDV